LTWQNFGLFAVLSGWNFTEFDSEVTSIEGCNSSEVGRGEDHCVNSWIYLALFDHRQTAADGAAGGDFTLSTGFGDCDCKGFFVNIEATIEFPRGHGVVEVSFGYWECEPCGSHLQ